MQSSTIVFQDIEHYYFNYHYYYYHYYHYHLVQCSATQGDDLEGVDVSDLNLSSHLLIKTSKMQSVVLNPIHCAPRKT